MNKRGNGLSNTLKGVGMITFLIAAFVAGIQWGKNSVTCELPQSTQILPTSTYMLKISWLLVGL